MRREEVWCHCVVLFVSICSVGHNAFRSLRKLSKGHYCPAILLCHFNHALNHAAILNDVKFLSRRCHLHYNAITLADAYCRIWQWIWLLKVPSRWIKNIIPFFEHFSRTFFCLRPPQGRVRFISEEKRQWHYLYLIKSRFRLISWRLMRSLSSASKPTFARYRCVVAADKVGRSLPQAARLNLRLGSARARKARLD